LVRVAQAVGVFDRRQTLRQNAQVDSLPEDLRTMLLDNARVVPLLLAAPPPPAITCDMLKDFTLPTLVMRGEKTLEFYTLISEAITKCVPGAQQVVLQNANHDGPMRIPTAFTAAVFDFLSRL
jgi:pimeloyl-ACP methyl ester carboxylesterase